MNQIEYKLRFLRKKILAHLLFSGLKICVIGVFSYLFIVIPIGYGFNAPPEVFIGLAGVWLCAIAVIIARYTIAPWYAVATIEKTARWIEQRIPLFDGSIISALQFSDPSYVKRFGLSASLIDAHRTQADNALQPAQILRYPQFLPSPQPGKYWCAVCALLIMPVLFYADFYAESFYQTYRKICCPIERAPEYLFVRPGTTQAVYGSHTDITAFIHTRQQVEPTVHLRIDAGEWRAYPLLRHTRYRHTYSIPKLENTIDYFISAGHLESDTYTIKPLILPVVIAHHITFSPPEYTGWEEYTVSRKQFDDITALKGTGISFSITSNNQLKTVALIHADNDAAEFDLIENDTASYDFTLADNDTYTLLLTDTHGQQNQPIKPYNLTAISDKTPRITILSPQSAMEMPRSMNFEILYEAADDIGIDTISLTYQIDQDNEETVVLKTDDIGRQLNDSYEWDLTAIGISPGQTVTYFLTASDAYPPPDGPHRSSTPKQRIQFPSLAQMYQRKTQTFDEPLIDFETVKSEHDALLEQMETLKEKMASADSIAWTDKHSMNTLMESQEQMQKNIENMSQAINEKAKNQQLAQNILSKYQEIQSITDSLLTDEMKESLAKLQSLIEQSQYYKQIEQQLEKMNADMANYNEQLDRTLSLLKQLSMENKLQEMFKATQSMLENQDALDKQFNNANPQASQIKNLLEEQNQFLDYLTQSMDTLPAQAQEATQDGTEQFDALKELYDNEGLAEQLQQLASMLQQNNRRDARTQSASFKSGVQKLNAGLDALLKQMKQQRDMLIKLTGIIDRIIRMKQELHKLSVSIERYSGKNKIKNIDHAKQIFFIQTELKRIGTAAQLIGKNSTMISPDYYHDFFAVADTLSQYNETIFKKGDMQSVQAIEIAQASLHKMTMKWIRLLEMIQHFKQQSGDGQGMPQQDMESFFDQLSQLANQQGTLNKQTAQIPGMMPSMRQQMGQYMQRMAAQQKMLSEALSGLNQSYSTGHRVLGDLNQIQRTMEEVAASLSMGDVSPELIQRQQQIHTRLLEAEKSLRTREKSNERESTSGGQTESIESPKELENALLERARQKILNRSERGYIPPQYRKMVEEYFRRLMELHGVPAQ